MSVDANKAAVERFYAEVWNGGAVNVVDDIFAPTYVRHQGSTHRTLSLDSQKQVVTTTREALSDLVLNVEVLLAEDHLVASYWRISGTDSRTGKSISDYTGVNIFRFEEGRVVEIWNVRDDLTRFQQIGVVPSSEQLGSG